MGIDALDDRRAGAAGTGPSRPPLRTRFTAWSAISLGDVGWTLAAAMLFTFAHSVSRIHGTEPWATPAVVAWEWVSIPLWLLFLAAFGAAELPWRWVRPRWVKYGIAAAVAVVLQFALGLSLVGVAFGFDQLPAGAVIWFGVQSVLAGALAALLHSTRARARRAVDAFASAALARALAKRRFVEARLSTVQAHADPDFIFDILTRTEDLYGHDATRAELLLSQLIDFLHEALPRVRDGRTTLGHEARLVGAWLAVARVRLDDRLDYAVDIPQSIAELPFHAMLLLPLVTGVLRGAAGGRLAVRAEARGDRIRISVTEDDGTGGFAVDGFDDLRTRLVDLYGEKAHLSIDTATVKRRTIVLEVPAEVNEPTIATVA